MVLPLLIPLRIQIDGIMAIQEETAES